MRNITVIQRHSPFNQAKGREALDMILALAAVEHQVSVLFSGNGIFQLLPSTEHLAMPLKHYQHSFRLFDLYDVEKVYACQQSMQLRGITSAQFTVAVTVLTAAEIRQLLASQQHIISC